MISEWQVEIHRRQRRTSYKQREYNANDALRWIDFNINPSGEGDSPCQPQAGAVSQVEGLSVPTGHTPLVRAQPANTSWSREKTIVLTWRGRRGGGRQPGRPWWCRSRHRTRAETGRRTGLGPSLLASCREWSHQGSWRAWWSPPPAPSRRWWWCRPPPGRPSGPAARLSFHSTCLSPCRSSRTCRPPPAWWCSWSGGSWRSPPPGPRCTPRTARCPPESHSSPSAWGRDRSEDKTDVTGRESFTSSNSPGLWRQSEFCFEDSPPPRLLFWRSFVWNWLHWKDPRSQPWPILHVSAPQYPVENHSGNLRHQTWSCRWALPFQPNDKEKPFTHLIWQKSCLCYQHFSIR